MGAVVNTLVIGAVAGLGVSFAVAASGGLTGAPLVGQAFSTFGQYTTAGIGYGADGASYLFEGVSYAGHGLSGMIAG